MRTYEELKKQIEEDSSAGKSTPVSEDESAAYFTKADDKPKSLFLTYTATVTLGERTVTKTASISIPDTVGFEIDAMIEILKNSVQDE